MLVGLERSEVPHALEFESNCGQSVALSHNGLVPAEPHSALHGVHMAGDRAAKQSTANRFGTFHASIKKIEASFWTTCVYSHPAFDYVETYHTQT